MKWKPILSFKSLVYKTFSADSVDRKLTPRVREDQGMTAPIPSQSQLRKEPLAKKNTVEITKISYTEILRRN